MLAIFVGSLTALVVSLLATPLLRWLAYRLDITDRPDALLKPHARPIAYLGGVGFYLGWVAGLAVIQLLAPPGWINPRVCWLVAGLGGAILLAGLADDIRTVKPWHRLVAEAVAATVLFAGGVRYLGVPPLSPEWATYLIGLVLQVVLVIGACNSTNLLDGLDGLCGGVSAIALAALAALAAGAAFFVDRYCPGLVDQTAALPQLHLVIVLAAPLSAATVAFLRYNYGPASIFMGDAGSLLLGFVIAACIALLGVPGRDGWSGLTLAMGGLVTSGVPVGDAVLAFVRRVVNHRPVFRGDRSHFYDQLVDRGWPVGRVVNVCYLVGALFAAIGWVGSVLIGTPGWSFLLYAAMIVLLVLLLWRKGFVRVDKTSG